MTRFSLEDTVEVNGDTGEIRIYGEITRSELHEL